jgi:hypothetical protein
LIYGFILPSLLGEGGKGDEVAKIRMNLIVKSFRETKKRELRG